MRFLIFVLALAVAAPSAARMGGGRTISSTAFGYGSATTGGAGQASIVVSNLNDTGAGSLRAALEGGLSNRYITFSVAGHICLASEVVVTGSNITIDGSTAPQGGVSVGCWELTFGQEGDVASNIHIRHMKWRHGSNNAGDAFTIENGERFWIDHNSFQYGSDQNASIFPVRTGEVGEDITFSNNIFAYPLGCEEVAGCEQDPGGAFDPHPLNFLAGGNISRITFYRNVWALGDTRNPNISAGFPANCCPGEVPATADGVFERVQNLSHGIKDSSNAAGQTWTVYLDTIDEVFTTSSQQTVAMLNRPVDSGNNSFPLNIVHMYYTRNREGTVGSLSDPTAAQENIIAAFGAAITSTPTYISATRRATHQLSRATSVDTRAIVLRGAGAILPRRDVLDERVIRHATNGTGRLIITDETEVGGLPDLTRCTSASCGFPNIAADAANAVASGATNTTINWTPLCTDTDSKPLAKHCVITVAPTQGTATITNTCSAGTFVATGVAAADYPLTYECCDGASCDTATATITVTP